MNDNTERKSSGFNSCSSYWLLAIGMLTSLNAHAIIDDTPYFTLLPNANPSIVNSVTLCGVSGCDASLDMIVEVANTTPAGSGVRDTFLRLQNDNANIRTETAYSTNGKLTDATYLQDDNPSMTHAYTNGAKDSTAGNNDDFNNAVLLSDLDIKTPFGSGNAAYYQIVLDVNEPGGGKSLIRLDEFEIHLSADGYLNEYNYVETTAGDSFFADGLCTTGPCTSINYQGLVYDMDFDSSYGGIILDSVAGGNGSGDEDYSFLLPVGLFTAAQNAGGLYMHLVSTFGEADSPDVDPSVDGYAESGFEEWAAELNGSLPEPDPGNPIPTPGTALLMAIGAIGLLRSKRSTFAGEISVDHG